MLGAYNVESIPASNLRQRKAQAQWNPALVGNQKMIPARTDTAANTHEMAVTCLEFVASRNRNTATADAPMDAAV